MKRTHNDAPRQADGSPLVHSEQPSVPKREKAVNLSAVCVGPVSSQSELSEKTLRIQNRRLNDRLELAQRSADALRRRAQQLEERKTADDTLLFALSSNWSRLDEDLRILLQRFDQQQQQSNGSAAGAPGGGRNGDDASNSSNANEQDRLPHVDAFSDASEAAQAFLGALSSGDKEEMDSRLEQRVHFTRETVSRILAAFDRLLQRQDRLAEMVSKNANDTSGHSSEISSLISENTRLQQMCTRLQSERHVAEAQATRLGDRLAASEARISELQVRADDLTEAYNGANRSIIKLDRELGEWKARAASGVEDTSKAANEQATSSPASNTDELNEMRELANERLAELQQVHTKLTDAVGQLERRKAEDSVNAHNAAQAAASAELESTRNQLAAVKTELVEMRTALDEARIQQTMQAASKQRILEQAEANEVVVQKELRDALDASNSRLSGTLAELEQLRSSHEQLRVAHEQTTLAAREMRALIESLRTYYSQLKRELVRIRQLSSSQQSTAAADNTITSPTPSTSSGTANTPVPPSSGAKSPSPSFGSTTGAGCPGGNECLSRSLLLAARQREESLVNELTVTSQAYEEIQEQSIRLTEVVKQKDEAALRLVEDRGDALKVVRLLRDEKDGLVEQVDLLQAQLEAQQALCHRIEDKESALQVAFQSAEREAAIRAQALEAQRRRAMDLALKLNEASAGIERYQRQAKEAQSLVAEKTVMVEKLLYMQRRGQEEIASLNRRLERLRRFEQMSAPADEVVAEELREYKELLACPICKVRQKDSVLTKCSHLFCMTCLRTRYETRQRKCPKCNAMFGANDFKRVFF